MNKLLLALALWVGMIGAGWARTVEQQILATLEAQGYVIVEQGYTFLGRLRIVAQNGELRREIVVNPGTGEILRDYAVLLPEKGSGGASGHGSGGGAAVASASGGGSVGAATASGDQPDTVTSTLTLSQGQAGAADQAVPEVLLGQPIMPLTVDGQ